MGRLNARALVSDQISKTAKGEKEITFKVKIYT